MLAGLGLYGVITYTVARRRTEIDIPAAIEATPASITRLILSRVFVLVAIGVVVGAGVIVWALQFVGTLLYGVQPRDPVTLAGAAGLLAAVGGFAGWLPPSPGKRRRVRR